MAEVKLILRDDLGELVHQIHKLWDDAEAFAREAQVKYKSKRIRIGIALLEAKRRVEAGEGGALSWWDWYKRHFERSREDATRVMKMAAAENPEAAHEAEKAKARDGMRALRDRRRVINNDDVNHKGTACSQPVLKVVESVTPPEPIVDYTMANDALNLFKRMNIPTRKYFIANLRKAYRESWLGV
jgi:hypothetical protein